MLSHGENALSSGSWEGLNSSLQSTQSDSFEPVMFVCSKCGLEFDGTKAELSDFDDSVQCPSCGNWE